MVEPIYNLEFYEFEKESPDELRDFAHSINKFRRDYQKLKNDLNFYAVKQIEQHIIINSILDLTSELDSLIWTFSALVKQATLNVKDQQLLGNFEEDLQNVMLHIKNSNDTSFAGPNEQRHYARLASLSQNLSVPFTSLIGLVIIDTWKNSRKERPVYKKGSFTGKQYPIGNETYCDLSLFNKNLIDSIKTHSPVFKKQLFIMSKGKIQQTFFSRPATGQTPIPVQKARPEDIFPDLSDETYTKTENEIFGGNLEEDEGEEED